MSQVAVAAMYTTTKSKTITVAAVEGGGTSFRLAVCQFQDDVNSNTYDHTSSLPPTVVIKAQAQVDSSHDRPQETLAQCAAFFREHLPNPGNSGSLSYDGLGIATFGPVGLSRDHSKTYGHILSTTPKASWRNIDIVTPLQAACGCISNDQILVETDVNAPAFSEYLLYNKNSCGGKKKNNKAKKNAKAISSLAYITVGTGVGVGLVVNDKCVHGRMHPEGGHVPIIPLENDTFTGYSWGVEHCPFQGKCTVEGVASSVALLERLLQKNGKSGAVVQDGSIKNRSILSELSDDDETWDHAANALASLCASLLLLLSVERIVLGGGILKRSGLLEKIQKRTVVLLNGYLELPPSSAESVASLSSSNNNTNGNDDDDIMTLEQLITTSVHGDNAGLQGAIVLAQRAYYQGRYRSSLTTTTSKNDNDDLSKDNKDALLEMKRHAFQIGWTYGMLVGAVGTALFMRYCTKTMGRRR